MFDTTFINRVAVAACVILLFLLSMIKPQTAAQGQLQPSVQSEPAASNEHILQLLIQAKTSGLLEVSSAKPVAPSAKPVSQKQTECLAAVIYHEARGESLEGQVAVATTTINRSQDSRWPSTICGVVHQKTKIKERNKEGEVLQVKTVCQYSWNCDAARSLNYSSLAYKRSLRLANAILHTDKYDHIVDQYRGVYYFHAHTANPSWAKRVELVKQTGNHLFYGDL